MTRSPVEFKDSVMIGGILQILNINYGSPFNEYALLWCMMVSRTSEIYLSSELEQTTTATATKTSLTEKL